MPQTIEQGDIFGRIGKAIGEGAGAGAAEQFGRNRFAGAIEDIQKKNMTPLQQFGELTKRGATPEQIQQVTPFLQQNRERQDIENRRIGKQTSPISEETMPNAERQLASDYLIAKPQEEINEIGEQLFLENPYTYKSRAEGIAEAEKRDQSRLKRENEYDTRVNLGRNEFKRQSDLFLEKADNEKLKAVTGEMLGDYEQLVQKDIDSGKNPKLAATDRAKEMLDFARIRNSLSTIDAPRMYGSDLKGEQSLAKLKAIRKGYEDAGKLDLYAKDLITKAGLSTPVADYLAFPIKQNKEINNFAQDTKKRMSLSPFQGQLITGLREKGPSGFFNRNKGNGTKKRTEEEIGDFISSHRTDGDSLNSLALTFVGRGYNGQKIMDRVQKNWENGKGSLSKRQQLELDNRTTFRPTLKDISYFSGNGLNPLEVIP